MEGPTIAGKCREKQLEQENSDRSTRRAVRAPYAGRGGEGDCESRRGRDCWARRVGVAPEGRAGRSGSERKARSQRGPCWTSRKERVIFPSFQWWPSRSAW